MIPTDVQDSCSLRCQHVSEHVHTTTVLAPHGNQVVEACRREQLVRLLLVKPAEIFYNFQADPPNVVM